MPDNTAANSEPGLLFTPSNEAYYKDKALQMGQLARQLAQVLKDYELLTPQTWLKKRKKALDKAKSFGISPMPF